MRVPDDFIWDYPGFPSIMVYYGESSDFFYSGHVGVCLFLALENFAHDNLITGVFSLLLMVLTGFIMIISRAHYFIDIVAGIVFSHYFWIMSERVAPYLDRFIKKVTYSADNYTELEPDKDN